ncbi:MAG: tetratricopeptide repeat protein [Verrucomicrobia bacterium]|nr:tetratricopeptide repeat protein [Verrucomicrobiota bacterium]
MQATKNRGGSCAMLCVALATVVAGCTPAGPRALLDGRRLLEEGRTTQAVEKLLVATSLLQTNAHAWNYLGVAHQRANQPANAAAAYQKALALNRDLLEARYNLGCLWLEQDRPELAKTELTTYTLLRGNDPEGWLRLATAQLRLREPIPAEKSFREVLRLQPNNLEALNGLGLVQVHRNRPRDAVPYFNAALKLQADYRPALLNLATVSQPQLNDRPAALQRYREYLALDPRPDNWAAVNAVAQALEQQLATPPQPATTNVVAKPAQITTNVTKAVASSAVQTTPVKTETPILAKKVEPAPPFKPETLPAAEKPAPTPAPTEVVTVPPEPVLRTAAEVKPPPSTANVETASVTGLPAGQIASLPAAVSSPEIVELLKKTPAGQRYTYLSPARPVAGNRRDAERAFAQGQQAHQAKRLPEAAQSYRQAIQADPGYFEAHFNLALVALESRNYRQSLAAWETALTIQPDSVDARYNFALALKAANYPADAARQLGQILATNPNETRAHLVLGNLWADQFGNPAQARAHYLRVLEMDPRHPQATAIRYWLVANPP